MNTKPESFLSIQMTLPPTLSCAAVQAQSASTELPAREAARKLIQLRSVSVSYFYRTTGIMAHLWVTAKSRSSLAGVFCRDSSKKQLWADVGQRRTQRKQCQMKTSDILPTLKKQLSFHINNDTASQNMVGPTH